MEKAQSSLHMPSHAKGQPAPGPRESHAQCPTLPLPQPPSLLACIEINGLEDAVKLAVCLFVKFDSRK